MDRLPFAMKKPAGDFEAPEKGDPLRQCVEMEQIIHGRIFLGLLVGTAPLSMAFSHLLPRVR
jgi:hypothetical protein